MPHLFYPITVILALLIWGLMAKRRLPVILALISLWLTSTPLISKSLIEYVEKGQLRKSLADIYFADAVVVLSGMLTVVNSKNGVIYEWGDPDRYFAGLELMQAKKSQYIIFTGGIFPWQRRLQSEGLYLAALAKQAGIPSSQVIVTGDVQNTAQEAFEVKKYLTQHNLKDIILVTSAYHMPRAEQLFKNSGIDLQTFPVDSKVVLYDITPMDFLPDASAFSANQSALRELIGRSYYFLREYFR